MSKIFLSDDVFPIDIVESSVWRRRGMRGVLRKEFTLERLEMRRLSIPAIIRKIQ
jgi:hypothetical protein